MEGTTKLFEGAKNAIVEYVLRNHPSEFTAEDMPLEKSLVEAGILDSYGIVELVAFLESNWSITIEDHEINRESLGSINRMAFLVSKKKGDVR